MRLTNFLNCLVLAVRVVANTEKVIFTAPASISRPDLLPNLNSLGLNTISPSSKLLRTQVARWFPHNSSDKGLQSLFLLSGLTPEQRYELRVCWAATEPTSFSLRIWTMKEAFDIPELISALADYSEYLIAQSVASPNASQGHSTTIEDESLLFLQMFAAADYFTTNKTLMFSPPPVLVDLILDPYLLNIFPQSLVMTAVYIILLAVVSWGLSTRVHTWLQDITEGKLHSA